jgi:predicted permease
MTDVPKNGTRWTILAMLVFVASTFIGGYTFINANFVTRREFDEVKMEQARRTPIVYGSINTTAFELVEIKRRLEIIESLLRKERR